MGMRLLLKQGRVIRMEFKEFKRELEPNRSVNEFHAWIKNMKEFRDKLFVESVSFDDFCDSLEARYKVVDRAVLKRLFGSRWKAFYVRQRIVCAARKN